MEIIRDLRAGVHDVLIGINLLREGLDMPEVSLVAILDADKEGFLRSETSLVQTIGRAARNAHGKVIMYADTITDSMRRAMGETERRREIQMAYNTEHGITPKTIEKRVKELIETTKVAETPAAYKADRIGDMNRNDMLELAANLEKEMRLASRQLEFERAAELRDMIVELRQKAGDGPAKGKTAAGGKNARRPRK